MSTLLEQWRDMAYDQKADRGKLQRFWAVYFNTEKEIYEKLLTNPDEVVTGTVKELADKFQVDLMTMVGFLDGINDSLKEANPIETMEEDTVVNLGFDKEKLTRIWWTRRQTGCMNCLSGTKSLMRTRGKSCTVSKKRSGTIVKGHKVGRNDPCPCGSGKKYKFCCGRK